MRTETEEALFVQNQTIVELGEENIRLRSELAKWTNRQIDYANYRRGVEDGHGTCQDQIKKDGEKAVAIINKLRGIMQNDILSALDDCMELGASAKETRDVIKAIIAKAVLEI